MPIAIVNAEVEATGESCGQYAAHMGSISCKDGVETRDER
jgi:hypothetical protein